MFLDKPNHFYDQIGEQMNSINKVFFVDDDELEHKFATSAFNKAIPAAQVELFYTIKELKDRFLNDDPLPDLVITDHMLLNELGSDLVKWLFKQGFESVIGRTSSADKMASQLDGIEIPIFTKKDFTGFVEYLKASNQTSSKI